MIVVPCFFRSFIIENKFSTSTSVRDEVGSSMIMIFAFREIALAISTICLSAALKFTTASLGLIL